MNKVRHNALIEPRRYNLKKKTSLGQSIRSNIIWIILGTVLFFSLAVSQNKQETQKTTLILNDVPLVNIYVNSANNETAESMKTISTAKSLNETETNNIPVTMTYDDRKDLNQLVDFPSKNASARNTNTSKFSPVTFMFEIEPKNVTKDTQTQSFPVVEFPTESFRRRMLSLVQLIKQRGKFKQNLALSYFHQCRELNQDMEQHYSLFLDLPIFPIDIKGKYSDDFIPNGNNKMCSKINRGKIFLNSRRSYTRCIIIKNLKSSGSFQKINVRFFLYKREPNTTKIILNNKIAINIPELSLTKETTMKPNTNTTLVFHNEIKGKDTYSRFCNIYSEKDYIKHNSKSIMIKIKAEKAVCFEGIYVC